MNSKKSTHELVRKLVLIAFLTAITTLLSFVKIPLVGSASVNLMLPAMVIGAAVCGPIVGAWLTVIPTIVFFSEAAVFLQYSVFGTVITMFGKGILAGLAAGFVYKLMSKKHPMGAVVCASIVAPVVNSGIFLLGCYLFLWEVLLSMVAAAGVGVGMLLVGLVLINFAVELVLCLVLCPTSFRIIQIAKKKFSIG